MSGYDTAADMWREYKAIYGDEGARDACDYYLYLHYNTTDPKKIQFCRELCAAMQANLPARADAVQTKTFEYGGYHFTPERKIGRNAGDFDAIMRRTRSDFSLGLSTYDWRKADYSYEGFYAASTDKNCDLFRCVENGRLYMPALNELFEYQEQRQRRRPPPARKSAVAALDKAKEAAAASPSATKTKGRNNPEL